MATIGEPVSGGTEGSVLFVDAATELAQDNAGLYFDQASNTLKSANAPIGSASENFTVSTGAGGPGDASVPPAGNSGDLLLKTGPGGSDPFGTAGSGGNIIISQAPRAVAAAARVEVHSSDHPPTRPAVSSRFRTTRARTRIGR